MAINHDSINCYQKKWQNKNELHTTTTTTQGCACVKFHRLTRENYLRGVKEGQICRW